MGERDWRRQLRQDMKQDGSYYVGRFVDFLKQEDRLKDTPEGLHQHVREIETYIRLYIQEYPVPPDQLTQREVNYYNDGALISVRSRINNAYRRFYAECYE